MKKLIAALFALTLVAAACGDSDSTTAASDDPRVAEVAAVLQSDPEFPIQEGEANCAAQRLVGGLSEEQVDMILADEDIDGAEDPDAVRTSMDALFDCVDLERAMTEGMVADGMAQEDAECVAKGFGEDELRSLVELTLSEDGEISDEAGMEILGLMFTVMGECGVSLDG